MESAPKPRIQVTKNGPYVVTGGVPLADQTIESDAAGTTRGWRKGRDYKAGDQYDLCRCGHSENKPFCDGHHVTVGFNGTETAPRVGYLDQAEQFDGPDLLLTDAPGLCAFSRFCDARDGIWNQVAREGEGEAVRTEARHCVGGRLVAWAREGDQAVPLEPEAEPSIGVVDDPGIGVAGGYRVWGGIQVTSSDGYDYEVRNRIALCRCGSSGNMPFCDGTHAKIHFTG
jgi:CDGSH-type Zn-finger protein